MSVAKSARTTEATSIAPVKERTLSYLDRSERTHPLQEILEKVSEVIAPVWPLKDYVAINPYAGISDHHFTDANKFLQGFSTCDTLMPLSYYAQQFQQGKLSVSDIESAIGELQRDGSEPDFNTDELIQKLQSQSIAGNHAKPSREELAAEKQHSPGSISDYLSVSSEIDWTEVILNEISKHCSAHYDQGQSVWQSPWKHLPLYLAWRSAAESDCNVEMLGLIEFRKFVASMPHAPEAAIVHCMREMKIGEHLWSTVLLRMAFSIPGWCAWTKYQDESKENETANDLVGLLAIRLAYEAALGNAFALQFHWQPDINNDAENTDDSSKRAVLLRASEIAFRDQLVRDLSAETPQHEPTSNARKLAQLVFCIDVRSERIRRKIEEQSNAIETFGFAGFFGMPVEFVTLGEEAGDAHVPVLLKPQFKLKEGLNSTDAAIESASIQKRQEIRSGRKLWKMFQTSAVGCFSFVETTGFLYAGKLFQKAMGWEPGNADSRLDGVAANDQHLLGPTLRELNHQGVTTTKQVDLAHGMLKNLGLIKDFAKLVTFCGHASQTDNNPLAAGLDCGACGGHSGEPNARMAAMLLNQPYIRQSLAKRGIEIPADTYFLGGLHNTTTDQISFFDLEELPDSHQEDFAELLAYSQAASQQTCLERLPVVQSNSLADLTRRATDWSEVRPEWGLAGNAAFIVAPRSLTKDLDLQGRSFLHSYDYRDDPNGEVLETIMTAPMVVAHLINMQYYASTVDNRHFGSGNKTVHNVVGKFGILSGNGGDLMTGLPWQSLHSGTDYQHLPMRLQSVISAPLSSIDRVIEKHESIATLLSNEWLHLVAIEDGIAYRYLPTGSWQSLEPFPGPDGPWAYGSGADELPASQLHKNAEMACV